MKKILLSSLVLASVLMGEKIVIGATPVPHAEILEVAKASLGAQGYELEIKVFNDYVLPNKALADKDLDANFMQHEPYLREFNAMNGTRLEPVFGVHLEPMGAYSKNIKSLAELKDGDKIAIPNDPTNESRALDLLAKNGLIELDTKVKLRTPMDITKNPKSDSIISEDGINNPYSNIVVVRADEVYGKKANALKNAILSDEVKKFINEKYKGAVIPSF